MSTTKVATLYLLLGSSEPPSLPSVESALASTLTTDFKAFTHGTIGYLTPTWVRVFDDSGYLVGYNVSGGVLDGWSAQTAFPYMTGFLWQLYARDPALDLGGARNRILGEPMQSLRDAGVQPMQVSLVNYGSTPSGYRNWPAMPPLPTVDAPAPAPTGGGFPWWVLFPFLAEALKHVR